MAASFGEDIEIDAENARDHERAKVLRLQYGAYPALEGMDFGTVLAGSKLEAAQQDAPSQTQNGVIAQQS
ncbi:hypothetical protein [Sinorhizobium meliloti]|uniref:hypothetical protein n=1 Tax=Rhizobium meliloti TaxID=382 RepID=UPI000FE08A79|nr:hypothetical protein [Sinorhizobium meliloti]RVL94728.1 hypothetical protein CN136_21675 [Sinorhizobium meliloti]